VSRASAAKKARRKRRQVARNDRWLPPEVHADVEGVALIANEIIARGWEFDREFSTENFITWFYPPSGVELDDEATEPVTRIWLSDPEEPHVILVGSGEADGVDYQFTVEELFDRLDEIEAYRIGDPMPEVAL
jgi:hypothetical protein